MSHIEVDTKMVRDAVLGVVLFVGAALFMWFGVRHCTGPWAARECHFESGWPMWVATGMGSYGLFLLSGDKLKEFATAASAVVRGTPMRSTGQTKVAITDEPPKPE
jgi:hypothetical protein